MRQMRTAIRMLGRAALICGLLLGAVVVPAGMAQGGVEPFELSARRQGIVDAAHYYLHQRTPYGWSSGAEPCSVNGADCECLDRLAYKRGTSNPRPGDLVFFDLTGDGDVGDAHDHTGVFVGNGMSIHASSYWGRVYKQSVSSFVDYERTRAVYVNVLS